MVGIGEMGAITMEESLHQSIGVADWKKTRRGGYLVVGSTTLLWFLFEKCGYSFFPFVVNIQLLVVLTLFLWAKSAILFNRPMPQLPSFEITEASAFLVADTLRVWINSVLSVARQIYVARNAKLLLRVSVVLWTVSFVGNFFNFLTILYFGAVLSLLIPILYERYQDLIDDKLALADRIVQAQYRNINQRLLHKIVSKPANKIKKM